MVDTIINSDTRIGIESPFVVKAGPGAGKTYWLVEHVRNVLANSKRLGRIRKVACISYTNVGVETIRDRLSVSADRVEVTTIHSFLYENIVGPYLYTIAEEEGFAFEKFRMVDDTLLTGRNVVFRLKEKTRKHAFADDKIIEAISNAKWTLSTRGIVFKTKYPIKDRGYSVPQVILDEYKKYAWEHGVMHYDDVLYFSYKLIEKHSFIAQVVGAKYPYIFLDEFQDSTPLQVEVLKQIASASNTIIGIIGDTAQSIYGFAGASPTLLTDFKLPNMCSYEIRGNRRSSKEIIDFLNAIRKDIPQFAVEERSTAKPILFVGSPTAAYARFLRECDGNVTTLSYANVTSNAFRKQINSLSGEPDLMKIIDDSDSNTDRTKALRNCLIAVELALTGAMKDALRSIGKQFEKDTGKSIVMLKTLIRDYDTYKDKNMTVFIYYLINTLGIKIPRLRNGKAKTFYDNIPYQNMAVCISSPDVAYAHDKTIHKAKGAEYDNVLVLLDDEKSLDFIIKPDLNNSKEEYQRVYYVACSRAKNRLAISVPSLPEAVKTVITGHNIPIDIVFVSDVD